ncbi:MAG: hypothetical protein EKE20_16680 [Candidatus Symbiopectobacterium sp. Dall1.0]|nr:hypothetical protein [Candidatus Symbiopectobacterium sp. Dall1.0]
MITDSIVARFKNGVVLAAMMSISAVSSDQSSAVTTRAKTVHMKDILALKKALKYGENQTMTFHRDLRNPTNRQRPDANNLKQVLTDLSLIGTCSTQLAEKINSSSIRIMLQKWLTWRRSRQKLIR